MKGENPFFLLAIKNLNCQRDKALFVQVEKDGLSRKKKPIFKDRTVIKY